MEEVALDLYGTLGVPQYTTSVGIRRAYLQKARRFHPDLHPDDPEAQSRMMAINVAYDTLSDPIRRAQYDVERQQVWLKLPPEPSTVVSTEGSGPVQPSYYHHHHYHKEPGLLEIAAAVLRRLVHCVAALLVLWHGALSPPLGGALPQKH